jgi:lysozyme family protein
MAQSTYEEALRRLLISEGGYGNHPSDPGGPTNFGITIHDYRRYVKRDATASDVRAMKIGEAKAIYRRKYWDTMRCADLPAGVDYAVFDYGVNSGIGRAGKVLRRQLGLADTTSAVTQEVVAAARAVAPARLVAALCEERLRFLKRLRTWPVFGRGWGRRVAEVRAASLAMAARTAMPDQRAPTPSAGKGVVPVNTGAQKGTVGGAIATGGAAAQQAHQAGARPIVVIAIVIVTVTAAVAAFLFWRWRQRCQQAAPA